MSTGGLHRWGIRVFAVVLLCASLTAVPQPVLGHGYPDECTPQAATEATIHQDVFVTPDDRHVVAVPVSEGDRVYVLQRAQDGRAVGVWHRTITETGSGEQNWSVSEAGTIENASGVDTATRTVVNDSGTYSITVEDPETAYLCIGNEVAGDTVSEPFQWEIRYAVNEQPDWWTQPTTQSSAESSGTVGAGFGAMAAVVGLLVLVVCRAR